MSMGVAAMAGACMEQAAVGIAKMGFLEVSNQEMMP